MGLQPVRMLWGTASVELVGNFPDYVKVGNILNFQIFLKINGSKGDTLHPKQQLQ